jgi:malonyl-CoA decarboxylase
MLMTLISLIASHETIPRRSVMSEPVRHAPQTPTLFDRALRRITTVWRDMASAVGRDEDESVEAQMLACLAARGGEVSARNRAAKLAETYLGLDAAGQVEFLKTLARFDSDGEAITKAFEAWRAADTPKAKVRAREALRRALEPPRARLLTQFTTIPDGMKFLVDLRARLLELGKEDAELAGLESDLKHLLISWFDFGFLELHRIDWTSPALLLERLVAYEAVHEIRSWRDLKNRLDADRRCYAFFHPRMPLEPLIFVEVALVEGLAGNVQDLLDPKAPVLDPRKADTAIFYSISNCQKGLSGISFGNFLIKRVVELLSQEFRNIETYATLSPIPGFAAWLGEALGAKTQALPEHEAEALRKSLPGEGSAETRLLHALERPGWWRDPQLSRTLEGPLVKLCAHYLLHESAPANPKRARDPVAHFHLSNGARIERINWLADTSERGLRQSHGLMVNYLYDPAKIEAYHEDYAGAVKRNASTAVRKLARGWH